jgi:hypothetical protein
MRTTGFLLFRLNFVDRQDLFNKPITTDADLTKVIEVAATQEFDVPRQGSRSSYRWALRDVNLGEVAGMDRSYIEVTLSREVTSRRGPIVTPHGITRGTSTLSPPSATLVRVLIDLKRHIIAVEEVPGIVQTRTGWKSIFKLILDSAAWKLGFTSVIRLSPIVPREIIASHLESFARVTRLRVTLSIPNPDLGPSFQRLYDEMKRGGVRELTEDMRNERGLTLAPETLPQQTLDMAMTGYRKGKIRLYGYGRDGSKDEFTIAADDVARIEIVEVRDFVEGYAAAQKTLAVKRFAEAIIKKIDENLNR